MVEKEDLPKPVITQVNIKVILGIITLSLTSENKLHLFTPISNPATSVVSSHTGSVCTRGHNPTHCKEGVVQCVSYRESGIGECGIDNIACDTLRVVDGRGP